MPRRIRALPARASPCSRRRAPLSSGEPVRPAPGSGLWPARGQAPSATALRSRIGRDSTSWTSRSAVSTPTPTIRASSRTIAWGPLSGRCSNRFWRASSISLIWPTIKPSRAMSRRSSAKVFGGSGTPSGVCTVARRSAALRRVGLRPAMLPRYRDTRGMDYVRFDATRLEPARQPEAVAAGFEGQRNPGDRAAGPDRLIPPAMQQAKQPFWVRLELLARLTLNAGKHAGNQPARVAQLDHGNDRAVLVQGDEGSAQVVRLGHRGTPSVTCSDEVAISRRPPHSIYRSPSRDCRRSERFAQRSEGRSTD